MERYVENLLISLLFLNFNSINEIIFYYTKDRKIGD
jgi:hypothetical protein